MIVVASIFFACRRLSDVTKDVDSFIVGNGIKGSLQRGILGIADLGDIGIEGGIDGHVGGGHGEDIVISLLGDVYRGAAIFTSERGKVISVGWGDIDGHALANEGFCLVNFDGAACDARTEGDSIDGVSRIWRESLASNATIVNSEAASSTGNSASTKRSAAINIKILDYINWTKRGITVGLNIVFGISPSEVDAYFGLDAIIVAFGVNLAAVDGNAMRCKA